MPKLALGIAALALAACGGSSPARTPASSPAAAPVTRRPPPPPPKPPFAVGIRTVEIVDHSRTIHGGSTPRTLVTYVRYPATGAGGPDAPAQRAGGPYPLIVFGHGYGVGPGSYEQLLHDWARAGYVVAAPAFPLENESAPGGPDESDLPNQPRDMSFVITRVERLFPGLVDQGAVAVAGHSDGGDTALAVAYDSNYRDERVRAAVILAGAEIPGVSGFDFPLGSPPLLAVQGTADATNPPGQTDTYYAAARPPKFRLDIFGAGHTSPYSDPGPELRVLERVSIAFLNRFLKHARQPVAANLEGIATLRGGGG